MSLNRRQLLRKAALGAAALSASSYNRVLGANERIGLGLIGCGNRGRSVLTAFVRNDSVQANALCDVYPARIDEAAAMIRLSIEIAEDMPRRAALLPAGVEIQIAAGDFDGFRRDPSCLC